MDDTKHAEIMLQLAQLAQQLCFNGQVSTGYFETLSELQSRILGVELSTAVLGPNTYNVVPSISPEAGTQLL